MYYQNHTGGGIKMKMYKTESYKGFKVYFRPLSIGNYAIAAQVPSISSQYIGAGRTKKEAFEQAKNTIDIYLENKR